MDDFELIKLEENPTKRQWKLSPLYKTDQTGKKSTWQVGFDGEQLLMTFGKVGGKARTTTSEIEPKSNRSLEEQALLEARSRYRKKHRKDNYRLEDEALELQIPDVMLANKWQPGKTKLKYPVWVQPKLNGIRLLTYVDKYGEVKTQTRNKKEYPFLDHITDRLINFFPFLPEGAVLDGELYTSELKFEEITGAVRRTKNPTANVKLLNYYIYDVILPYNATYNERYDILFDAYDRYSQAGYVDFDEKGNLIDPILILSYDVANSAEDIFKYLAEYEAEGYEGIIIRKIASTDAPEKERKEAYYISKRGNNILKYKNFEEEEADIIDVSEGKGTEAGIALVIVQDIRGNELRLRPKGSFENRREWLENPESIIGKKATIEYQELSKKGVPIFPVLKDIRDYE